MKAGGSVPHSQGLSNNPYPAPNQLNSSYLSNIHSLTFLFLATLPAHFNLLYLITLTY